MKKNKIGISLIVLVITIIVIIILSGTVILSLANNSPIESLTEVKFKVDMKNVQNEVLLYSTKLFSEGNQNYYPVDAAGKLDNTIIKSVNGYDDKLEIYNNLLTFTGTDATEIEWAIEVGLNIKTPMSQPSENTIMQIETGGSFSVLLYSDSTVRAFGSNNGGQLGTGNRTSQNTPEYVMKNSSQQLYHVKQISAGDEHVAALLENGTVVGWGDNYEGQLGDGFSYENNNRPLIMSSFNNTKSLIAGGTFTYSINNNDTISNVGSNYLDINISSVNNVKQITSNFYDTIAVLNNGTSTSWGYNVTGALGIGTQSSYDDSTSKYIPVQTTGISNAIEVELGGTCSYFLLADKTVKSCGDNYYGELGIGSYVSENVPTPIVGLANVKSLSAGNGHALALLENGTVMSWGNNDYGQLGDGTYEQRTTPVLVTGLSNVVQISAGGRHNLALLANGSLMAWGDNGEGQLGDGTTQSRTTPILINTDFPAISSEPVYVPPAGYWSNVIPGDTVKINLTSDDWGSRPGFRITKIKYVLAGNTIEENLITPVELLNYPDSTNQTFIINRPGATSITVNFEVLSTEETYDFVYLLDSSDNIVQTFTGQIYNPE